MRPRQLAVLAVLLVLGLILAARALAPPPLGNTSQTATRPAPAQDQRTEKPTASPAALASGSVGAGAEPAELARSFHRSPAAPKAIPSVAAPPPPPEKPSSVAWLKYLGYAERDGAPSYYFKDSRSNRVIALRRDERNTEWQLVEKTAEGFLLREGSSLYFVSSGH